MISISQTESTERTLMDNFFMHNPLGCISISNEGVITDINMAASEILGYRRSEIIGQPLKHFLRDSDLRMILDSLPGFLPAEKHFRWDLNLYDRFCDAVSVSCSMVTGEEYKILIFDHNSGYIERINELERDQILAHLGTWDFSCDRNRMYWSNETFRIFGIDPAVTNPGYEDFIECIHPEDRELVEETLNRSFNTDLIMTPCELRYRIIHGITKKERWVYQKFIPNTGSSRGFHELKGIIQDITEERAQEEHIRLDIYKAIASTAEHRDNETGEHMKRIGEFCHFISKKLQKPGAFADDIRIFAPLHDIGKVGISDEILRAPRALTEAEIEIMKTHTSIGYDILNNRSKLEMAAEIAKNHHEKFDGTGYPSGITGTAIPLAARICAVADVYDSLRSKRCYKEAYSEEQTLAIIEESSGKHFDPQLVRLLIDNRKSFDSIFKSLTDAA